PGIPRRGPPTRRPPAVVRSEGRHRAGSRARSERRPRGADGRCRRHARPLPGPGRPRVAGGWRDPVCARGTPAPEGERSHRGDRLDAPRSGGPCGAHSRRVHRPRSGSSPWGVRRCARRPPDDDVRRGGGPRGGRPAGHFVPVVLPGFLSVVLGRHAGAGRSPGGGRMNAFGSRYRTTIFGTSHGPFVGCTIEGLRAGTPIEARWVQGQLDRRRPGQSLLTSQRKEEDRVEFAEGLHEGATTGKPIVAMIRNQDVQSKSYANNARVPRPGHGDFTALMKYGGKTDLRGGGQLSGRMTAPLVVSGAVARQVLEPKGARFFAHAAQIGRRTAGPVSPSQIEAHGERTPGRCADRHAVAG